METVQKYLFRGLVAASLLLLAGGTIFYHFTEKWSWINSYYFCVVSLTTVGYGDLAPHTDAGKLFTTFYLLAGIGVITAFITTFIRRQGDRYRERSERRQK